MLSFTSRRPLRPDEDFTAGEFFWVTTGTFQKRGFIAGDHRKEMLLETLDFNCYKWGWRLVAYVILDNHYHLVLQTAPKDPSRLAFIIQSAHSFSAYHWRREDSRIRTRIWWNFWESPIASLHHLRQSINYVHANPQFHRITDDPARYPHSSYAAYLAQDASAVRAWEQAHSASELDVIDTF